MKDGNDDFAADVLKMFGDDRHATMTPKQREREHVANLCAVIARQGVELSEFVHSQSETLRRLVVMLRAGREPSIEMVEELAAGMIRFGQGWANYSLNFAAAVAVLDFRTGHIASVALTDPCERL